MNLIKAEKISYAYPSFDEEIDNNEAGKSSKNKNKNETEDASVSNVIPEEQAITDVSLEIEKGDFVCILGRNGSGKSTFARHLNALLVPDSGTLWVDGMDSRDEGNVWNIRSLVGMVFQNPDNQIIGSVVDEDVAFGPENMGIVPEEIQRRVKKSLEDVGLSRFAHSSPNKLSGGQKQRSAIAGILAMEPECIVLDESTAMLDPKGRYEVMDTVEELNRRGITVICITHYMDEAIRANKVFVMDDGKLIMQGTPREIFSRTEELEALGLRLPQISELAYKLKKSGVNLPDGLLTAEELKTELLKIKCR